LGTCSRIMAPVAERVRAVLVAIVKSKTLLAVFATKENLASAEKDRPSGVMSLQEKLLVLFSSGEFEELVRKLAGGIEPHPQEIEIPLPPDRGVDQSRIADPFGEFLRPQIRSEHLRCGASRGRE
jgi:hypothetical protein